MTPKQIAFAREVAKGKDSLTACYRKVYSAENMKPAVVRQEASRVMANPKVSLMVERIRTGIERATIASVLSDKDRVLTKLRDLLDNAEGTPAEQVMLRAADLLGRTQSMYSTGIDLDDKRERSPEQVRAEIERRLALLDADDEGCDIHDADESESLH